MTSDDDRKLVDIFMKAQATPEGEMFSDNILRGIKAVLSARAEALPTEAPSAVVDAMFNTGIALSLNDVQTLYGTVRDYVNSQP